MLYAIYDELRGRFTGLSINSILQILDQIEFRALAAALLAFAIVLFAGRPIIRWLREQKIGDTGMTDADALRSLTASKANTPTMGGVLIIGAIIVAAGLLADIRNFYVILGLVVALWLAAVGGADDWLKLKQASRPTGSRQGLYAWEKLIFQLAIGAVAGWFLYRHADAAGSGPDIGHILNLPFQKTYLTDSEHWMQINPALVELPRAIFVLFAILMVAGMSNAVNITDGMDGLAAGITTVIGLGLIVLVSIAGSQAEAQRLLVPFVAESHELLVFIAALVGACLGFLWWNCAPAHVFMGDTGSLALGGLLAYVALVVRQEVLLLIMSAVFLVEIASVVGQVAWFKYTRRRTGTGRRLFKVAPIHHHFHVSGWTEHQVVARFCIVSMLCVVVALTLLKAR
jgi:phospho-N-acetylmuramoyl-pentapeptide-transferase